MSVSTGRALFEQMHTRPTERAKADPPKTGAKGIAAGRALFENKGKRDPIGLQVGEEGTEV